MGKQKDKRIRSIYCHEQTKAKPPIKNTRYKKLSLGNVQKHNKILETSCKPLKNHFSKIYQMETWSPYVN